MSADRLREADYRCVRATLLWSITPGHKRLAEVLQALDRLATPDPDSVTLREALAETVNELTHVLAKGYQGKQSERRLREMRKRLAALADAQEKPA